MTDLPAEFNFYSNYPNPFNATTRICCYLEKSQPVQPGIYNVNTQLIKQLVNEFQQAGSYEIAWDTKDKNGREVSSGVYFGVLQIGFQRASRKIVLIH